MSSSANAVDVKSKLHRALISVWDPQSPALIHKEELLLEIFGKFSLGTAHNIVQLEAGNTKFNTFVVDVDKDLIETQAAYKESLRTLTLATLQELDKTAGKPAQTSKGSSVQTNDSSRGRASSDRSSLNASTSAGGHGATSSLGSTRGGPSYPTSSFDRHTSSAGSSHPTQIPVGSLSEAPGAGGSDVSRAYSKMSIDSASDDEFRREIGGSGPITAYFPLPKSTEDAKTGFDPREILAAVFHYLSEKEASTEDADYHRYKFRFEKHIQWSDARVSEAMVGNNTDGYFEGVEYVSAAEPPISRSEYIRTHSINESLMGDLKI